MMRHAWPGASGNMRLPFIPAPPACHRAHSGEGPVLAILPMLGPRGPARGSGWLRSSHPLRCARRPTGGVGTKGVTAYDAQRALPRGRRTKGGGKVRRRPTTALNNLSGMRPDQENDMSTPQMISLAIAALYALHVVAELRHW